MSLYYIFSLRVNDVFHFRHSKWMCLNRGRPSKIGRDSSTQATTQELHCLPTYFNKLSLIYYLVRRPWLSPHLRRSSFPFNYRTRIPSPFHQLQVYSSICALRLLHSCMVKTACIRLGLGHGLLARIFVPGTRSSRLSWSCLNQRPASTSPGTHYCS